MKRVALFVTVLLGLALVSAGLAPTPVDAQGGIVPTVVLNQYHPFTAPGFYDETDPRFTYTQTWTNWPAPSSFGGTYKYAGYTSLFPRVQFKVDHSVGSVRIYYEGASYTVAGLINLNGSSATTVPLVVTPYTSNSSILIVLTPGVNTIFFGPATQTVELGFTGISAQSVAQVFPTAIQVILPTHTPTPTATVTLTPTPTKTNTPGPSPTPTATATVTAQPITSYQVNGQDVVFNSTVTPGDAAIVGLLAAVLMLGLIFLWLKLRSEDS